ncbi:MAG: DUF3352 domain-containing protein [Desulfocapsa sp.]|nr:DUF3352 domain-containing protein [Desulfocapsa sp.]
MKKTGIVLIIVLCGLGLVFFLKNKPQQGPVAADFLPSDVLFYGEQLDFTEMHQAFIDSRLGKTLNHLDYDGIAADLGSPEDAIMKGAEELWKKSIEIFESPGFDELLGKEFSLALFHAKSFSAANPAKALEERLLLIARPRHNTGVLQLLAPLINRDIEQSTVQYGIHTITRYKVDEENTVSTATVKGLILAAFDERLVRKSLDSYDDGKDTLSTNDDFQRLRKSFLKARLFVYFSLPALCDQGRMIAENLQKDEQKEFLALLEQWRGWGAAAYGAWRDEGIVRDKTEILYSKEKLDPHVAELFAVQPVENGTMAMVPSGTLLYYWTNTLNLPLIWGMYVDTVVQQQPEALDVLRQELRDSVGVELEELLAMIDKEFAFIVKDIDREGIPLPRVAGLVQLKNPKRFLEIFNALLQEADIPFSTKVYKGRDITYWGMAPQEGLQPAFCLLGDYLLLSNSIDLVKQLVALESTPQKSLFQSAALEAVKGQLAKKNNSATYVDIAHLADALKDLVTWGGTMAVLQGPEVARKAEIVVNKLFLPLLDGIAMYTRLGSRSVISEDRIVLESTITVAQ